MITHQRLKELLDYSPDTGIFAWKMLRGRARNPAGTIIRGYRVIGADMNRYRSSRLAWFYVTGTWPRREIDHKNLNTTDDRFANLRECTRAQNISNTRTRRDNVSGFKGVQLHPTGRWRARLGADGKTFHLGLFDTPEEAHAAYCDAAAAVAQEFARFE